LKLTKQDKAEVLKLYASGYSASEIAKKFQVSHTAISKILNNYKSCNEEQEVSQKLQKVAKQDNHAVARRIIDKAMATVEEDIKKASPMDRIRIVERLMFLYGNNEGEKSKLEQVVDAINRISGGQ
jgi:predicted DNA-binding protein YlxM (UPF0122 family)